MPTQQKYPSLATVLVAFISVLPATIASVASLIIAVNTNVKVEQVHKATNSMKDDLVAAALLSGHRQGIEDERNRELEAKEKKAKAKK